MLGCLLNNDSDDMSLKDKAIILQIKSMKKLKLMMIGIGFLSFLSCTQTSQYAVKKYVEDENAKLPIKVTEYESYDSIKCNGKENNVIMYYSVTSDLVAKSIKEQDSELAKKIFIDLIHKRPDLWVFIQMMKNADYSITVKYLTSEHAVVKEITVTPEEYGQEVDAAQAKINVKDKINDEVKSIKSLCPSDVDEYTILKDVEMDWEKMRFTYQYELHDVEIEDPNEFKDNMREHIRPIVLGPSLMLYRESNITIIYQYKVADDTIKILFMPEENYQ